MFSFHLFVVVHLVRVADVKFIQVIRVHVGVEVSHDGEDDADGQQQAGKQQELDPLQPEIPINGARLIQEKQLWLHLAANRRSTRKYILGVFAAIIFKC